VKPLAIPGSKCREPVGYRVGLVVAALLEGLAGTSGKGAPTMTGMEKV